MAFDEVFRCSDSFFLTEEKSGVAAREKVDPDDAYRGGNRQKSAHPRIESQPEPDLGPKLDMRIGACFRVTRINSEKLRKHASQLS